MDSPLLSERPQANIGPCRSPLGVSGFLVRLGTFLLVALSATKFGLNVHCAIQQELRERTMSGQQADVPMDLSEEPAGELAMWDVGNVTPAVADLASVAAEETAFEKVLALSTKPPYWYVIASGGVKPVVMAKVFGPPKAGRDHPADFKKNTITAGLIGISSVQGITDLHHVYQFATSDDFTFWEKVNGAAFALSISTNFQTAVSLSALHGLYQSTWSWLHAHSRTDFTTAYDVIIFKQGRLWWIYYSCMWWIYFPLMGALALFLSIGLLGYCWLSVLVVGGLVCWAALQKALTIECLFTIVHEPMEPRTGEALEQVFHTLDKDAVYSPEDLVRIRRPLDDGCYAHELKSFNKTGVPGLGWTNFFLWPIVSLALAVMGPIVCRFYIGTGYYASIGDTWGDRHLAAYVESLSHMAAGRWTQAVSYII